MDITVALPTYDNSDILWLQLESLCRQETQYSWELIVCEEPSEQYSGKAYVMEYEDRLRDAGCGNILYIGLDEHVPLSFKWVTIAQQSSGNAFVLAASDNYSAPDRLEVSYGHILDGYSWVDVSMGLFLDLKTWKRATFKKPPKASGLFMCTKTKHVKSLVGPPWPASSIDGWMKKQIKQELSFSIEGPTLGLHTDGANKISKRRRVRYAEGRYGKQGHMRKRWLPPQQCLEEIISDDIIKKLKILSEGF